MRGYPRDLSGRLVIAVTDPLLAHNTGRFAVEVTNGCAGIGKVGDEEPAGLTLGIASLASLYSGHTGVLRLQQTGLLHGEPASITLAARLFHNGYPWMTDRF
ncbi:sterol carrier protein domain-containing protein [Azospirillum thermophilum]|uniref:sterol carrier protein domain-containing protein n=1 Tax=Azospirillum thermophilum TaxID=2202148 RepID=UPI00143D7BD3|nr:sterol carrier protein domain-containing protein [Azospirillum thermophilum]